MPKEIALKLPSTADKIRPLIAGTILLGTLLFVTLSKSDLLKAASGGVSKSACWQVAVNVCNMRISHLSTIVSIHESYRFSKRASAEADLEATAFNGRDRSEILSFLDCLHSARRLSDVIVFLGLRICIKAFGQNGA